MEVRNFSDATIEGKYDYLKQVFKRHWFTVLLHIGTNNTMNEQAQVISDKIFSLKSFIGKTLLA